MRPYSSAAPAPLPAPRQPTPGPEVVPPRSKRPRRPGRWLLGILFFTLAGGWLYQLYRASSPGKPAPAAPLRTATVRRGTVERTLRLNGTTVARKAAILLTPLMLGYRGDGIGQFMQILQKVVPPGSRVHKGDLVAEFDRMYMLLRMDDYKAWVNQHKANTRRLRALLDVRRVAYEQQIRRYKALVDKSALDLKKGPVLSAIKTENLRLDLEFARASYKEIVAEARYVDISETAAIRRAELDLKQCQIEYDRAQRNLDRMIVRAPMDGLVVMQSIYRGSDLGQIQQGDQIYPGQPYMQVVDLSSMAIDARVNQVDIQSLHVGQRARVRFDAYPGLELPARVVSVGAFAGYRGWRVNWVREVGVRLRLDQMDPRVAPNLSVSADVILGRADGSPVVPRECVFHEDRTPVAFVQTPSGWEKRELALGLENYVSVAVRSGLREGEVVAAEWPAQFQNASN